MAKKWGIENLKIFNSRKKLENFLKLLIYAKFGNIQNRRYLNDIALGLGIDYSRYNNKENLLTV